MLGIEKLRSHRLVVAAGCAIVSSLIGPPIAFANQIPDAPVGRLQFVATPYATAAHDGTIVVVLKIYVRSAIPASTPIMCTASVSAQDSAFQNAYSETATVTATRSGTAAFCTMTVPYHWVLGSSSGFTAGYSVYEDNSTNIGRSSNLTRTAASPLPANGATTTITYSVTF